MPVADYPTLPASPETSGTIAGDVFTQAVAQVSVAADKGDTLPILTGVRMEIDGDKVTLLATDRYRLAMRELTWSPSATDASHVALIPARQLSDTARALGASGSVELALGSGRRRPHRLRGRPASRDDAPARRRVPQGHLDLPDLRRHRGRHRDGGPRGGRQARRPRRRAQHARAAEVHRRPGGDRGRHR